MRNGILTLVIFALTSPAFGQTGVINSILNGFNQPRMSPGDVVSMYGVFPQGRRTDFTVTVGNIPAYVTLAANDVKLNRLFQLQFQVPTEISPGPANVVIAYPGGTAAPYPVTIVALDPMLSPDAYSTFLHTSGVGVTPTTPASPGETITTFMGGLGVTSPNVPTGTEPADFTPTAQPVTVTIGGTSARIIFAGRYAQHSISPALNYQVSFVVPAGVANGQNAVLVSIGGVNSNTQTLYAGTPPLPSPPVISKVVNGGNFASTLLAPGSFVTIFGTGFGTVDNLSAFPNTQVNGISVLFNGQPAPIFHLIASGGQINVLSPSEIPIQESVNGIAVTVVNQNGPSKATFLSAASSGPAMFSVTDPSSSARRNVAALLSGTAWYVMPASQAQALGFSGCAGLDVSARCGQPAKRGDFVQVYVTGLGLATANGDPNGAPLATGQVAPANGPVYYTLEVPIVTIGGQPVKVTFSGLAPGYAGLYQLNFQIPANAPVGDSVPITLAPAIAAAGSAADTATIAIQ